MKKRSLFILPFVLAALSACENGGNNSKPYVVPAKDINSMADFLQMVSDNPINNSASKTPSRYSLNVDLDFKNASIQYSIKDVELIGNKHRIKNFTSDETNYGGLFSKVNNCIISDLTIMNAKIGGSFSGGLVGYAEIAVLQNIKVAETVEIGDGVGDQIGGIVGYAENAEIRGCENNASVNGMNNVGGIVGHAYNTDIVSCLNNAEISASMGEGVGGVCGTYTNYWRYEAREDAFISNSNYGDVNASDCNEVGGLIGKHHPQVYLRGSKYPKVTISKSFNAGVVQGKDNVGGIAGSGVCDLCDTSFISCVNQGSVIGENHVGGIAGYTKDFAVNWVYTQGDELKHVSFTKCSTKLNETSDNFVKGEMYVGGIAGNGTSFISCTNNIDVITKASLYANTDDSYLPEEYQHYIGGIVGYGYADFDLTLEDYFFEAKLCTNNGKVMGINGTEPYKLASSVGGICGYSFGGSFTKCNNNGELNAAQCVGGIIGTLVPQELTRISENNSNGKIITNLCAGGLIGDIEANETNHANIRIGSCVVDIDEAEIYGDPGSPESSEPHKYVVGGLIGRATTDATSDEYFNIAQLINYTATLKYKSPSAAVNMVVNNVIGYNQTNANSNKLVTYTPESAAGSTVERIGNTD